MIASYQILLSSFYKYRYHSLIFLSILLVAGTIYQKDRIRKQLDAYAKRTTLEYFGTKKLAASHELMIKEVALKMGITEPIEIHKMNQAAMSMFGYCNAFAYFPVLFYFIPITNQPYLFVSEGFFEDLSLAEQQFLIGHELAHIKEHHVQFLNLYLMILTLVLLFGSWVLYKRLKQVLNKYSNPDYLTASKFLLGFFLIALAIGIPELIEAEYRKRIERQADHISLVTLNSYDGCIKIIERWSKEFRVPMINSFFGIFSSHPSAYDRKNYCVNLKNQFKETL